MASEDEISKIEQLLRDSYNQHMSGLFAESTSSIEKACLIDAEATLEILSSDRMEGYEKIPVLLGKSYVEARLKRFPDVIQNCEKILAIEPKNFIALNNFGLALAGVGEYEKAIEKLEESIRIKPDYEVAIHNRAAVKAEYAAHKAIEDRIGSLNRAVEDIEEEQDTIERDYRSMREERDSILKRWIIGVSLTAILVFLFSVATLLGYASEDKIWPVLSLWSVMTITISVPILILLRLKSRDVEELKILSHDYLRMMAIETRLDVYQVKLPDEKHQELMEKQFDNWINNSPADTLIKFKHKATDKATQHPMETMLSKCAELLQRSTELLKTVKK